MTTTDPSTPPQATPPAPPPSAEPPKTFTQEDVDRIIKERLDRAKVTPPADYDDLKKSKKELDELKAAQLSETEKLTKAAAEAEARAKAAEERASGALRRSAVITAAQRAGAIDPDAVFALIDSSLVTVGDDGQVTGAEDAVKALLADKQYLVGKPSTPTPGGADGGPRGKPAGTITREQLKTMTSEQITAARKAGELEHLFNAT